MTETVAETMAVAQQVQQDLEQLKPNVIMESIKGCIPGMMSFGYKLIIALIILFIGSKIIKGLLKMLKHTFDKMNIETGLGKFLISLSKVALYCILILICAEKIGLSSSSIIAVLGSAGIAVGLALQGSLANLAGGILILLMKPFIVGDYIIAAGGEGTVKTIGLVYTTLITVDNKKVVIPNGSLSNSSVTNATAANKRRVDLDVGISYQSDLKKAKAVMQKLIESDSRVMKNEPIAVIVSSLEDSAVMIGGRCWVATSDYWNVLWDMTERIKLLYDEEGIEIPYNQLDVHMR